MLDLGGVLGRGIFFCGNEGEVGRFKDYKAQTWRVVIVVTTPSSVVVIVVWFGGGGD